MERFDVIVVGAGHAGIEAALASARLGRKTLCVTLRLDRIGHLPCNCSIGGPAKGHIAREVDALGGQMGVTTDHTLTHLRKVGTGKGPAVQTTRAQVCKSDYPAFMRKVFEAQPGMTVLEGSVDGVATGPEGVCGIEVTASDGARLSIACRAVVLTTGTFLNGLCHEGRNKTVAAREGDRAVVSLSDFLLDLGVRIRRFKTGTTPRIRAGTIDFSQTEVMPSEPEAGPLSALHDRPLPRRGLLPTWQTRTSAATHALLRERLGESAMYSGEIEGVGPRYCPSIEDKVVRFAEKDSHPIFLEVEEWDSDSVYVQGFSSSMPAEVQLAALRTVPGLAAVEMIRPGYAVEYDMADPLQLWPTLMSKLLDGLFLAGQINGTSGYEEAAGQGIVAGINAARYATGEPELTFSRTESFIGVMTDDLVTKGVEDPYRMLTSRAEHRLVLRHDNADLRLTPLAARIGLACETRRRRLEQKQEAIALGKSWLEGTYVLEAQSTAVESRGSSPVRGRASLWDLLKRPDLDLDTVEQIAAECGFGPSDRLPDAAKDGAFGAVGPTARAQIEIEAVYCGYLQRQVDEAALAKKMEALRIPKEFRFDELKGLSHESKEKLGRTRPTTVGQASRIPGVRPSDVALLIGHLRHGSGRTEQTEAPVT
ncbi:MAG: tRNA uridine-5-carboxymethylaminomethyl(34) synthesis enzyme MnmG [Armatimonadetes bacterium]|nr:tRNA uridine-5-carboxymethylaminomethyl(34) synthesis enzyme MnmG [Armatimonadota bacterium]